MGKIEEKPRENKELREQAERIVGERNPSDQDIQVITQELRVHQVELEIQNEDLRRIQAELAESRNKYYDLYDLAPIGYLTLDKDRLIQEINLTGADLFGVERRYLIKKAIVSLVAQDDRRLFNAYVKKAFETGTLQTCELKLIKKDGPQIHAQLQSHAIQDDKGIFHQMRIAITDITSLKEAQGALDESNTKYATLVEQASEGVIIIQEGVHKFVNKAEAEMMGYTVDELIGKPFLEIIVPEARDLANQKYNLCVAGGVLSNRFEIKIQAKDGTIRDVEISTNLIRYQGKPAMMGISHDISERKKAEEEVRQAYRELNQIFNSTADASCVISMECKILRVNNAFYDLLGISEEEIIGKNCYDFLHGSLCKILTSPIAQVLDGEEHIEYETEIERKDGTGIPFILTATPFRGSSGELIGVIENFKDMTDHKRMEEEMQRAEKLRSIGTLAGGLAHDFNNILAIIVGNLSLLEMYLKPTGNISKVLKASKTGCHRADQLIQQLLTFSKGGAPVKKPASIRHLLEDTIIFTLRGSKVKPEFSSSGNLWPVEIDEGQISQVISNLIINANQAMPHGGLIKICTENAMIGAHDGLPLKEGKYVRISVIDQGVGIPKEYLTHIFDPYFTTKKEGKGLGLAICYSIINRHGGCITVESESGVGTTFSIYLPASEKEFFHLKEIVEEKLCSGRGKILLMDDDESLRDMICDMLAHLGYEVEPAGDGDEAIELYRRAKESNHSFDGVILDLTIPGGMGGEEVMKRLIQIDPEVKAIVSSGYSNDPILSTFSRYGFGGAVSKPFEIKELSKVLGRVVMRKK